MGLSSTSRSPHKPEHHRRHVVPRDVMAVSQQPVCEMGADRDDFVRTARFECCWCQNPCCNRIATIAFRSRRPPRSANSDHRDQTLSRLDLAPKAICIGPSEPDRACSTTALHVPRPHDSVTGVRLHVLAMKCSELDRSTLLCMHSGHHCAHGMFIANSTWKFIIHGS